jgi:hypothetical protein
MAALVTPVTVEAAFGLAASLKATVMAGPSAMFVAPVTTIAAILANVAHDRAPALGSKTTINSNIGVPSAIKFPGFPHSPRRHIGFVVLRWTEVAFPSHDLIASNRTVRFELRSLTTL